MSGLRYLETVSTGTEAPNAPKKADTRFWTPSVFVMVVLVNIVQWATDWAWWAMWVPAACIFTLIVVYSRIKNRRSKHR